MKYLLLDHKGVILHISSTIGYQENGNPLVDNGTLAYAAILVDQVVEVEAVPDGVEPMKWRYLDGEFTRNPNWVEPGDGGTALAEALAILRGEITEEV